MTIPTNAKPLILRDYEAQALADGRLGAIVRAVRPQPKPAHQSPLGWVTGSTDNKNIGCFGWGQDEYGGVIDYAKPPCRPGDNLWCKEAWCMVTALNDCEGKSSNLCGRIDSWDYYKADGHKPPDGFRYCSPVAMPREACRHVLTVRSVEVCRVQELTKQQCFDAGADGRGEAIHCGLSDYIAPYDFSQERFAALWDKQIKPADRPAYGYEANPWVFYTEVERVV